MNKRVIRLLVCAFGLGGSLISTSVLSSSEPVRVTQQSQQAVAKPTTGQSMATVEANYGQPIEVTPAVGEPPITRWRYAEFTVYFEDDIVIHSVAHRG